MRDIIILSLCALTASILPPSSRIEKERTAANTALVAAAAAAIYDSRLGPDGRLRPREQGQPGESRSQRSLRPAEGTGDVSAADAALQRRPGETGQNPKGARRPEFLLPEDDEAYEIRLTTIRPRRTTAEPYQDYPDYELTARAGWPPPQENPFSSVYGERQPRPLQPPIVRPVVEQPLAAPTIDDYRPAAAAAAALPPLRFRQRRPNDVWVRTNGAYPEFVNLRSIGERIEYRPPPWDGSGISDIGLPPISDPVVPLLPVENYPAVPYPDLQGYPDRQPPYEGYGSYRNRPVRVVESPSGYGGRYVEPRYANRGGNGGGYSSQSGGYGVQPGAYGRPAEYSVQPVATVPPFRSFPSQPAERGEGRGWRTIASPYGYSYAGYIERQSRMYPIMIYTLESCPACHSAKRLLALNYADVASHFLELAGEEEWQRQLHIDLQNLTGAGRFPYVFVCGQFIGGSMDLHELHRRGQLRLMLQQCNREGSYSAAAAAAKTAAQR